MCPPLKHLVHEASQALAQLDADRLSKLVVSCQALHRAPYPADIAERVTLVSEVRGVAGEMAVFARVLEATRANVQIMRRLKQQGQGIRLEYGPVRPGTGVCLAKDGDN